MAVKTTVHLRIDPALADRLRAAAEADRRSLNGFLEVTLQELMDTVEQSDTAIRDVAGDPPNPTKPPATAPSKLHEWGNHEQRN